MNTTVAPEFPRWGGIIYGYHAENGGVSSILQRWRGTLDWMLGARLCRGEQEGANRHPSSHTRRLI